MKRFALAAAVLVCLSACTPTKEILYRIFLFGTMKEPATMLGDDGRTYHFSNIASDSSLPSEGRVAALLDAYEKGENENYTAQLLSFAVPLCVEPVECSTPEEDAALGDAPIRMDDGIVSGGHLNMICTVMLEQDSEAKHEVNLQVVQGASTDTLHVVLRHSITPEGSEGSGEWTEFPFYASFPIADRVPEGQTTILEIKWLWDEEWNKVCVPVKK